MKNALEKQIQSPNTANKHGQNRCTGEYLLPVAFHDTEKNISDSGHSLFYGVQYAHKGCQQERRDLRLHDFTILRLVLEHAQ